MPALATTISRLTEFFHRAIDRRPHSFCIANVRLHWNPTPLRPFDHLSRLRELSRCRWWISQVRRGDCADVESHHVRTRGSQCCADRLADATGRTSDERRLTVESEVHMWSLVTNVV